MIFANDILYTSPELYITFFLSITLVYGALIQKHDSVANSLKYVSKFSIPALFLLCLVVLNLPSSSVSYVNFLFIHNQLSFFSKLSISFFLFSLSLSFINYYKTEQQELEKTFEHSMLMMLSVLGMFVVVSSNDFLIFFLGIELQSLSLYVLAASKKKVISSLEAGLKYFVLGAFSSGILLLGISFIYGSSGMTNFHDIKYFLIDLDFLEPRVLRVLIVGFCFVSAGVLFKLPAAPFHSWAPDVYTGSPTFITAFFSVVPKTAVLAFLIKIYYDTFFYLSGYWSSFLIFCSICSFVVGSLGAIYNTNLKRLMTYGTINHIGFMLLALSTVSVEGLQACLFYLIVYLMLSLNFFSVLVSVRLKDSSTRLLNNINDLSSLVYSNPIISVFVVLNLFSMAGIPPLSGFFSKFYVLYSSLNSGMFFMSVFAVITSAVSCFYYIRMVKNASFEFKDLYFASAVIKIPLSKLPAESCFVIVLTGLFNLFFFLNPDFLLSYCYSISYKILM